MTIGRPFAPGQSGNPGGRPKTRPFKEALDRAIEAAANGTSPITLDDIAMALMAKAKTGDVPAIKELAERMDGKVPQAIIGDLDEPPIQMVNRIELVAPDVNAKD